MVQSVSSVPLVELRPAAPSAATSRNGGPFSLLLDGPEAAPRPRAGSESSRPQTEELSETPTRSEPVIGDRARRRENQCGAPDEGDVVDGEDRAPASATDESVCEDSGQPPHTSTDTAMEVATPAESATPTPQPAPTTPVTGPDPVIVTLASVTAAADASVALAESAPAAIDGIVPTEISKMPSAMLDIGFAPVAVSADAKPSATADADVPESGIVPVGSQAARSNLAAAMNLSTGGPASSGAEADITDALPVARDGAQPVKANPVAVKAANSAPANSAEGAAQSSSFSNSSTSLAGAASPATPASPNDHAEAKLAVTADALASSSETSGARNIPAPSAPQAVLPEPVRALAATLSPASLHAATASGSNPVPLTGLALAIEIVSRAREGNRQFDIRLDPPELGRIDVRLDVDRGGNASTRLTVDRPETLALLQREASGLERALQSAGLKTDEGGLEFSLRYQAQDGTPDRRPESTMEPRSDLLVIEDHGPVGSEFDRYGWAARARGGIDIRV